MVFNDGLRLDLVIEEPVIVELKSVESLGPFHKKQLSPYPQLTRQPVGLLIHCGAATLKEGPHRIVNNLSPSASPRPQREPIPEFQAQES